MAPLPGFIGAAYQSLSPNASADRLVNLYLEPIETGKGPNTAAFYPTPGLSIFATATGSPVHGLYTALWRTFAVAGNSLLELSSAGTITVRGTVGASANPSQFSTNGAGGSQLFLASGDLGYVYNLTTNTLTQISTAVLSSARQTCFMDGYTFALLADGSAVQFSALENAASWNPIDKVSRVASADPITGITISNHLLWIFGTETTQAWYNSGDATTPIAPIQESVLQQGAIPFSIVNCDNTVVWIAQNRQGIGMAYRAEGYRPLRISTHAIETIWQTYATLQDAVAWTYQLRGHVFYVVSFVSANHTWVLDVSNNTWHEWVYRNPTSGEDEAHRGICQTWAFGTTQLVGDRLTGTIYQLTPSVYMDGAAPIIRLRQMPHVALEQRWLYYHEFQLYLESGLGLPSGQGSDPQLALSWSSDGGHTFGNELWTSAGPLGGYSARARWMRLGRGRDRVFRVKQSDPIPSRWIDAYLDVKPGGVH